MKNENIETILKQLVKAVELLLKAEARRLHSGELKHLYEEEDSATVLADELLRQARSLHQALDEAE